MHQIDPVTFALLTNIAAAAMWDGGTRLLSAMLRWREDTALLQRLVAVVAQRTGVSLTIGLLDHLLGRADLIDLVRADLSGLVESFAADAADAGLTITEPEKVLSAVLAAVAASDSELARRLHDAQVLRLLDEIDAGLGYVFGELLDEILAVRRLLDPLAKRTTRLATMLRESEALVVSQFMALGVERSIAEASAKNHAVGVDVTPVDGEVVVVTAVAGSGKSLAAIRTHEVDIVDAVMDDQSPVPVLLHTRQLHSADLRDMVVARTRELADVSEVGCRLVLDGLDEATRSEAQRLLYEALALVSAWPTSSAIAFGRPDVPYNGVSVASLPLPECDDLEAIASQIVGHSSPFHGFSPAMRSAVELPLYAIAAAVLVRDRQAIPQSRAAIIGSLIQRCLRDADVPDESALRSFAVRLVVDGDVAESALGPLATEDLTRSRLVIRDSGSVRFAVPIYRDWFAAQALLVDDIVVSTAPGTAVEFERWRHPLALAFALGSSEQVDALGIAVAETAVGGIGLLLDDSTTGPSHAGGRVPAPSGAADRIDLALKELQAALHLPLSAAGREAFDPENTAIVVAGSWADIEFRNSAGEGVGRRGTLVDSRAPGWPWRLALGRITDDLERVVDRRLLGVDHPVLRAELVWALARLATGSRGLAHGPIPPEDVLLALGDVSQVDPSEPVVMAGRRPLWMQGHELAAAAETIQAAAEGGSQLVRPWPRPDNLAARTHWTADVYTPMAAATIVRDTRTAALDIYTQIVASWFPMLGDYLTINATLPMINRCVFAPRRANQWGATLSSEWYPLSEGEPSLVVIEVQNEIPLHDWGRWRETWAAGWQRAGRTPPPFTKAFSVSMSVVEGLLSDRPATGLAYRWLAEDLRQLEWREAMVRNELE